MVIIEYEYRNLVGFDSRGYNKIYNFITSKTQQAQHLLRTGWCDSNFLFMLSTVFEHVHSNTCIYDRQSIDLFAFSEN